MNHSQNQIVENSRFILDNSDKVGSVKIHTMLKEMDLCSRVAVCELGKRLLFHKTNKHSAEVDDATNIDSDRFNCLNDSNKLNVMKLMGTIVYHFFQNKQRMITSGILPLEEHCGQLFRTGNGRRLGNSRQD